MKHLKRLIIVALIAAPIIAVVHHAVARVEIELQIAEERRGY